uniref:Putative secreted peptide n=1 Tax=Anopheles braziliensis TaxID=58242 RepID=A0A2M3ZSW3_9DIPT
MLPSSFWLKFIRLTTSVFPCDHRYLMKVLMIDRHERCSIPICAFPYRAVPGRRFVFANINFAACGHNTKATPRGSVVKDKHIGDLFIFAKFIARVKRENFGHTREKIARDREGET